MTSFEEGMSIGRAISEKTAEIQQKDPEGYEQAAKVVMKTYLRNYFYKKLGAENPDYRQRVSAIEALESFSDIQKFMDQHKIPEYGGNFERDIYDVYPAHQKVKSFKPNI